MRYVLLVLWMTSFLHNAQVDHESFTVYVTNQSTSIAAVSSGQQVTRKCIFLPMLQATSVGWNQITKLLLNSKANKLSVTPVCSITLANL